MPRGEALFPPERYQKRRTELAVDAVIRRKRAADEWMEDWEAAAVALRSAARAVDIASYVAENDPAPYAAQCHAITVRELVATLTAFGLTPGGVPIRDPFSDFIASLDTDPAAQDHRPPA